MTLKGRSHLVYRLPQTIENMIKTRTEAVSKTPNLMLTFLLLTFSCAHAGESSPVRPSDLDPEQILRKLVRDIPGVKMVTPEGLEPNPQGKYRRHAFIRGDFNQDGQEDIAISATDEWTRGRNAYVLIATKRDGGTWYRTFLHKFPGIAHPFLIWDEDGKAILVGANYSDTVPGDIMWDANEKKYKLVY